MPDHENMGEIEADILRSMLTALFGDTAELIGHTVAEMPERRRANVVRICKIALRRLGVKIAEPGSIPPRVAGMLLNEGAWVRDTVASEYWGGILANARSTNPMDDRAARRLGVLGRLGEYDLRSHYLFYTTLRLLLINTRKPELVDLENDRVNLWTFIPCGYYILAMDYNRDEIGRMPRLISNMLYALGQEFLLQGSNTGTDDHLRKVFNKARKGVIRGEGIVFEPSILGVQLFLWVFGNPDSPYAAFMDSDLNCRIEGVQMGIDEAGLLF